MYSEDNVGYIEGRLDRTVIRRLSGRPVLCKGVKKIKESVVLYYSDLDRIRDGDDTNFDSIGAFNLKSPPLGFTNFEGKSYFISRIPMRRDWRQGIRADNLVLSSSTGLRNYHIPLFPLSIPILKEYPSYKETVDRVEDVYISCAFSRHFALDERGSIWYKGKEHVGEDRDGSPVLTESFLWLQELLEEELTSCGN